MQKIKKTKRFRLLTAFLAVVMMFALSIQAYAATSKPVTQDGITATLVTDKDSYQAGESVNATVKIENNTGKEVFVFTQITVPSAVKLAGASAFDAVLANGQSWTSAAGVLDGTAGSTATGDQLQAGLWSVVSLLAIAGVAALLVYGKNRKNWVSMMLCVVMIGGLMAAAVPAQAAGVSGSMSVSCPIQLDGKAAEVTAIVNYIIGYEAGSAATTTPSETPTAAPTTAPTEVPTEAPTEAPTAAPTETPTEAPTQAPDETEVPDEAGYYVVWDDFNAISANTYSVQGYSSWDVYSSTSIPLSSNGDAWYVDDSEYTDAHIQRAFNSISDDFTWEFTLKADSTLTGSVIDMRSDDVTAIRFMINGTVLELVTPNGNVAVCELSEERFTTLKVEVSLADGIYSVMADGVQVAEDVSFLNTCTSLDRMYIQTTEEATGNIYLTTVRIYVDYYVNEKFLNATEGNIPDDWTATGEAVTAYAGGTQGPDKYSVSMSNGATLSKDVAYEQDGSWVEYQLLIPESMDEFSMTLEDEAGNSFVVSTVENEFGYYKEDGSFEALYTCMTNMWYHVMFKQTDEGGMLYLNHKLKAEGIALPFEKFTKMTFEAGNGQAYLDDIILKDWIPYPEDYVPEPTPVVKEEDATLVGLQSCNLWVEGQHFGYDWLTQWDARTPVLGYYDETSAETADWEIKFKVEHGIDFEMFCWYRAQESNDEPIKSNRNGTALHEGYFNSRYSDKMKFAITWENYGGPVSGSEDFRENVVPYWIEQYFKDDRYLVIDNKPVVGMYAIERLLQYFGGTAAGVKAELDYLRQACVEAGFDGCYIIVTNSYTNYVSSIVEAGFDGQYAYHWGTNSRVPQVQKDGMNAINNATKALGDTASIIPTVVVGYDDRAWDRTTGGNVTAEEFEDLLKWVRDDFMPTLDSDSLGSKMVMLGNWNEYGEGHYIMPANLNGFGYVDAIRNVFGDGTEHEDIIPTAEQRARINHMYVQDREVIKVDDTDDSAVDMEVLQGYYFEAEGDLEGWEIGTWKGENLDVENLRQEDGAMKGNTYLGDESYADPALTSPEVRWYADSILQIRVRMKASVAADEPELYFITESENAYSQDKVIKGTYLQSDGDDEGYSTVTFDVQSNKVWVGTITQIRLDPITKAGSFEIDSIEVMALKRSGDAIVYYNGAEAFTDSQVRIINGSVMYPIESLNNMVSATWCERIDHSAIETFVAGKYLYRFPADSNTMIINGETYEVTQGACEVDGAIYVPVADMFEAVGYIVEWKEEEKALYIAEDLPYNIVKAFYFNSGLEGWMPGGSLNTLSWLGGAAYGVAGDDNLRLWSPETAMNISTEDVTHIRIRVKSDVKDAEFKIQCHLNSGTVTYTAPYVEGEDGYADMLIDCSTEFKWTAGSILNRICIYPFSGNIGKAVSIDSVELVQWKGLYNAEVLKGYYFEENTEGFAPGGMTGMKQADGALVLTAAADGKPRVWTTGSDASAVPLDIPAVDADYVRLLTKTDVAGKELAMFAELADASGNVKRVTYTALLEATEEYTEILVDLKSSAEWDNTLTLKRLCILPFGDVSNAELAGKVVSIDAIEVLTTGRGAMEEEPEEELNTTVPGGIKDSEALDDYCYDDGVGEVASDEYRVLFGSTYFKNGIEYWSYGGATKLEAANGAMRVTAAADGRPRMWSSNTSLSYTVDPLEISTDELTHIRIRVKSPVEDLKMVLQAEYIDSNNNKSTVFYNDLAYGGSTDDYTEILVDCSNLPNNATLDRLGVFPFGTTDNADLAGKAAYFGSIEFLQKIEDAEAEEPIKILVIGNSITQHAPNANIGWLGTWGMAATSPEKDYVHILQTNALDVNSNVEMHWVNIAEFEKYFYNWDHISRDYTRYAEFDPDILISTIGANVKNGANEGDSGYENSYTFTKEKFKAILDYFNPGDDAKVIVGGTPLMKNEIASVIEEAAAAYGYDYVDMTDDSYTAKAYESTLKSLFGVSTIDNGVLTHPGDIGMATIAERIWAKLSPMIPEGEEKPDDSGSGSEGDDTPAEDVVFGYYFTEGLEDWVYGGGDLVGSNLIHNADGSIQVTAKGANIKFWSPEANLIGVSLDELTHIRLLVKSTAAVENPVFKLDCYTDGGSVSYKDLAYTAGADNYTEVFIDCTATDWGSATTLNRLCLWPYAGTGAEETFIIDSIEFLNKGAGTSNPDEGGEDGSGDDTVVDENVLCGYYFESATEGFTEGGLTGKRQENGALVLTAAADGRPRVWTTGNDANAKPLNIPAADAGYVRIMVQTDVTDQTFSVIAELVDAAGAIKSVTYNVTPDWAATGYTEILVDLKSSEEWDDTMTLNRVCVLPFGTVDNANLAGKVVYIDELEVLKEISAE